MKIRSLAAVAIAFGFVVAGCSSSSNDPASVVSDYLEVWNAEDGEAVMVFYTEDAVLEGHPDDTDGFATGKSEILVIETSMDGLQGSTGSMEFLNIEVSDDTATYDSIFRNRSGESVSRTGTDVTVEGNKIALMVWGDTDAGLC